MHLLAKAILSWTKLKQPSARRSSSTTMGCRSLSCRATGNMIARLCSAPSTLIELEGKDLRTQPIEDPTRQTLRSARRSHTGITLNEHYEGDGATINNHACRFGCEGIVSKRLG